MLKKHLMGLALLASLGSVANATVNDPVDDRWYVAPFGTFINSAGDRGAKDDWGGGMAFGKMLNEHFNTEIKGFYQGFNSDTGGRWDMTGGTLDLQYYIFRDKLSPYVVIGAGGMNTSFRGNSGISFLGEAGAGLTYELHDNFLIRSDVRYRYVNDLNAHMQPGTDEFHDMTVNLGFVVPFGDKPKAPAVAQVAPAPIPAPVAKPDCSVLDDDKDGVNNCKDKCPGSLPGVEVSVLGCWIVDVKFDNDKDIIKPQYFAKLDKAAENLKRFPDKAFEVQGHTSQTGTYKHNLNLSERRALAVKKYLTKNGHVNNLTAKGYSWDKPIDTNETEEGRANNRRVQLEVDGKPQQPLKR
jgi:OOP family OmpA-OmpF porin